MRSSGLGVFGRLLMTAGAAAVLAVGSAVPARAHEGHGHEALHHELGNQHEWEHQYLRQVEERWNELHPDAPDWARARFHAHLVRAHRHNHRALDRIHNGWHQEHSVRPEYRPY